MYKYKGIMFMLNNKCKYECDNCFGSCNGDGREKLDRDLVLGVLNQLPTYIREVFFTGGEPFEEYDDLKEYISLSRKMNKLVECRTSCFWADDYENTYKLLKDLRTTGLARIVIDYDGVHYHREKANNVMNVIDAAKQINISVSIKVTNTKDKKLGDEISLLGNKIINTDIRVTEDIKNIVCMKSDKNYINKSLFINYDGNVYTDMQSKIINSNAVNNAYIEKDINKIILQNITSNECKEGRGI